MIPTMYCTDSWLGSRMRAWRDLDQDAHLYLLRGNHEVVCLNWTSARSSCRNINGTRTTWRVLQVVHVFIPRVSYRPLEMSLPRTTWATLNSLAEWCRTFSKWGLTSSPNCISGPTEQTSVFDGLLSPDLYGY